MNTFPKVTRKAIVNGMNVTLSHHFIVLSGNARIEQLREMAQGSTVIYVTDIDTNEDRQVDTTYLIPFTVTEKEQEIAKLQEKIDNMYRLLNLGEKNIKIRSAMRQLYRWERQLREMKEV